MNLREPLHGKEAWLGKILLELDLLAIGHQTHRSEMERLKKFAATTQAQLKEATSQINSPLKATTSVAATPPKTDNEGKSLETLKKENEMLQKNMTNLVEDFTKLNVQLNDYKAKVYDLENSKKSYSSEVKQLQKQVNEAEVKLRRKSITLKKTKDGDILEKLVEDNDNYREQVHTKTQYGNVRKMKKQAQLEMPPRHGAWIVVAHQKRQHRQ